LLKLKLISTCCTLLLVGGCGSDHQSSSITDTSQIKSIYNVSDVASLDIDINCSNVLSELKKSSKDVVIFFEKSVSGGDEVWIDYVQPSDGCTNEPSNIELGLCNEFSNSLNLKVKGLEGGKFSVSGESKDELGCEYITTFSGNDGVVTGTSNDNGSCEFKLETVNDRYLVCSN